MKPDGSEAQKQQHRKFGSSGVRPRRAAVAARRAGKAGSGTELNEGQPEDGDGSRRQGRFNPAGQRDASAAAASWRGAAMAGSMREATCDSEQRAAMATWRWQLGGAGLKQQGRLQARRWRLKTRPRQGTDRRLGADQGRGGGGDLESWGRPRQRRRFKAGPARLFNRRRAGDSAVYGQESHGRNKFQRPGVRQ